MLKYILTLVYIAGHVPSATTFPDLYDTKAQCMAAGAAKKTSQVLIYSCSSKTVSPPPEPTVTPAPPGTHYQLAIVFGCPVDDVCGEPPATVVEAAYDTLEACRTAGDVWMTPAANPTGALKTYVCAVKTNPVCP